MGEERSKLTASRHEQASGRQFCNCLYKPDQEKFTAECTYMVEPSKTGPTFIQVFIDKPIAPTHQSKIQEKVYRAAKDILAENGGNIFLRVDEKGEISESFSCSYTKKIENTEFSVFIDVSAETKQEEITTLLESLKEADIPKIAAFTFFSRMEKFPGHGRPQSPLEKHSTNVYSSALTLKNNLR